MTEHDSKVFDSVVVNQASTGRRVALKAIASLAAAGGIAPMTQRAHAKPGPPARNAGYCPLLQDQRPISLPACCRISYLPH